MSSEAACFLTGHDWSASDVGCLAYIFPSWGVRVYVCIRWVEAVCLLPPTSQQLRDMATAWEGSCGYSFQTDSGPLESKGPDRPGHSPAHSVLEERNACSVEQLDLCLCESPGR